MESLIEFTDGGAADVEIALSGKATPASFLEFTEALAGDPRYRAGLRMLVDVSALEASQLVEGLEAIAASILERDWFYPPLAVAIIAPDDGSRIRADALAYRAYLGGSRSSRRLFDSRDEALVWLQEAGEK